MSDMNDESSVRETVDATSEAEAAPEAPASKKRGRMREKAIGGEAAPSEANRARKKKAVEVADASTEERVAQVSEEARSEAERERSKAEEEANEAAAAEIRAEELARSEEEKTGEESDEDGESPDLSVHSVPANEEWEASSEPESEASRPAEQASAPEAAEADEETEWRNMIRQELLSRNVAQPPQDEVPSTRPLQQVAAAEGSADADESHAGEAPIPAAPLSPGKIRPTEGIESKEDRKKRRKLEESERSLRRAREDSESGSVRKSRFAEAPEGYRIEPSTARPSKAEREEEKKTRKALARAQEEAAARATNPIVPSSPVQSTPFVAAPAVVPAIVVQEPVQPLAPPASAETAAAVAPIAAVTQPIAPPIQAIPAVPPVRGDAPPLPIWHKGLSKKTPAKTRSRTRRTGGRHSFKAKPVPRASNPAAKRVTPKKTIKKSNIVKRKITARKVVKRKVFRRKTGN